MRRSKKISPLNKSMKNIRRLIFLLLLLLLWCEIIKKRNGYAHRNRHWNWNLCDTLIKSKWKIFYSYLWLKSLVLIAALMNVLFIRSYISIHVITVSQVQNVLEFMQSTCTHTSPGIVKTYLKILSFTSINIIIKIRRPMARQFFNLKFLFQSQMLCMRYEMKRKKLKPRK